MFFTVIIMRRDMDKKWKDVLKNEKKVTEEDIIGLVKKELPYNSVEIKKRRFKKKGFNCHDL